MRVTQNMLNQNMLFNLSQINKGMNKYQDQASSGKKISKPSDNPVTAVRGMYYRSSLNEIDQFKRNVDDGTSWMETTDESLNEVTSVLQRVRELTVQGLNGTNDPSALNSIAEEINQLKEHLGEISNTQIAGKYIFAGSDVKTAPYSVDPANPGSAKQFRSVNSEMIELQIGQTNTVQINISGVSVFNNDGNGGIFTVLTDIVNNFKAGNPSASNPLDQLDKQTDNVLRYRSELGARMNRMELSASRLDGLEVSTSRLLSNEEDADMAEVITNLKTAENVQRAALSIGARVIQPSLIDFLR